MLIRGMATENKAAALIEQVLEVAKSAARHKNRRVALLLKHLREHIGLSQAEFAARLGISVPTVSRWESLHREAPPVNKLSKLYDLLKPSAGFASPKDFVFFEERPVCIRPLEFLLERQKEAREVWLIKFSTEFSYGMPGQARDAAQQLLRDKEIRFKFFFRGPDAEFAQLQAGQRARLTEEYLSPYPALVSYARFKHSLFEQDGRVAKSNANPISRRVQGWLVSQDRAYDIGLSVHCLGTVVLIYDEPHAAEYGRQADVFVEFPVALCDPLEPVRLAEGQPAWCWLQLPAREADRLWLRWGKSLREISQDDREFCKTPEDFEKLMLPVN
jgi:transcriptional regulator with XRE-family HTH domain